MAKIGTVPPSETWSRLLGLNALHRAAKGAVAALARTFEELERSRGVNGSLKKNSDWLLPLGPIILHSTCDWRKGKAMYVVDQQEIDAVANVLRSKALFRYGIGNECDRFDAGYAD